MTYRFWRRREKKWVWLNGYGWSPTLIIEDWDFLVVVINARQEYESIVLCYSPCISWQSLVPCMFYTLHYYIKDQNE